MKVRLLGHTMNQSLPVLAPDSEENQALHYSHSLRTEEIQPHEKLLIHQIGSVRIASHYLRTNVDH